MAFVSYETLQAAYRALIAGVATAAAVGGFYTAIQINRLYDNGKESAGKDL